MATGNDAPAQIGPALTLAELQAVVAIISPQDAGKLSPVFALVPLYALRSGKGVDAVWASPAVDSIDHMMRCVGTILTVKTQTAAVVACAEIAKALSPDRMRERMMAA